MLLPAIPSKIFFVLHFRDKVLLTTEDGQEIATTEQFLQEATKLTIDEFIFTTPTKVQATIVNGHLTTLKLMT